MAGRRRRKKHSKRPIASIAACRCLIERRLARVAGLQTANMNVATERLSVRWDKAQCKPSNILQALREI